jgi:very-short-patch-repair endonuclease
MTNAEIKLWVRLRGKQIWDVQFYRQKPIGHYIADFYAPRAQLVVEVDGSQHFTDSYRARDEVRDAFFASNGLEVLRFNNLQVLKETEGVMHVIHRRVKDRLGKSPRPPSTKGE